MTAEKSEEGRGRVVLSRPLRHRHVVGMKRAEIEAIVDRVAERLKAEEAESRRSGEPVLVDAATLARILGVSRATVYAHADELGAIRLGTGSHARLRFDPRRWLSEPSSTEYGGRSNRLRPQAVPSRQTQRSSTRLLPIRPAARRDARRGVADGGRG